MLFFLSTTTYSQEKKVELNKSSKVATGIGVVDMKKFLSQSTAYQSVVEQFEDIRRKQKILLLSRKILLEMKKLIF